MREWLAAAIGSIFLAGSSTGAALPRNDRAPIKERPASSTRQISAIDIACISAAVAARESALATVLATKNGTETAAYTARATALSAAYTGTDAKVVKASVKTAWDAFATAQKNAKMTYQRGRESTWQTFKSAIKACKGGESVSDSRNSTIEQ